MGEQSGRGVGGVEPWRSGGRGVWRLAMAAGWSLAAGSGWGCYEFNPLFDDARDFDTRVSLARLREITPLELREAAEGEAPGLEAERARMDEMRARFEERGYEELTIERARQAVLEHNLDLRVALINPTLASEGVLAEEGAFEALLFGNLNYLDRDQPVISALQSGVSETTVFTPGLRVPLRTGGTAEVRVPLARNQTDNVLTAFPVTFTSDYEFSLSQPLLRGAGRRAATFRLRIADIDRQVSLAQTRLEVIRQIATADRAYWRLYSARQELLVRVQQYELALEQLGRATRRFEAGLAAEIEVTQAQSGVADRIEGIIVSQNNVLLRQRELKRLLNIPGLDVGTEVHILTVSDPDPVRYEIDAAELAERAIEQRIELLDLELQLARDAATIAFQKNQALPLFTLGFIYRINGLGIDSITESFRVASENRFEDVEVSVNAEIPIGGNTARNAAVQQAVLTRLQRLATSESRRQQIRQEVLDAADSIQSGYQRILAARQSVALNARSLEAEQRQFEVGRSTTVDVLDAESRLAEARLNEISAVVDYQVSQIDLAFATGTLLGAARVEWGPIDPRVEGEPTNGGGSIGDAPNGDSPAGDGPAEEALEVQGGSEVP